MTLELAYLSLPRVRDGVDSQATNHAHGLQADHPARHAHAIVGVAAPQFVSHSLTRHAPRGVAVPRAGELHLWRFRCEWLPVAVQEGDAWLSKLERERARLHPNPALRKRFTSARVVTFSPGRLNGTWSLTTPHMRHKPAVPRPTALQPRACHAESDCAASPRRCHAAAPSDAASRA